MKYNEHENQIGQQPGETQCFRHASEWRRQDALTDQIQPVKASPCNERPVRTVPQSTEEHRDHEVPERHPVTAAVTAQRHIEVIAQPTRKGDMPSRPELAEAARPVRTIEVDAEVEAEETRQPDGNVRVA